MKEVKILEKERAYDGFFPVNSLTIKNSKGKTVKREQVVLHDAVAGLVFDKKNQEFILVKQFRVGPEDIILEIPAGKMDVDGESPEQTLEREILEEIGYKTDKIESIAEYYPAPGSSTEKIYLFYVEVSEQIEEGGGVETEDIEIVRVPVGELSAMFREGKFQDGKTIMAISKRFINNIMSQV
jgi:nudix-type nucleoside diphosphatase (YffH/AdpP family)